MNGGAPFKLPLSALSPSRESVNNRILRDAVAFDRHRRGALLPSSPAGGSWSAGGSAGSSPTGGADGARTASVITSSAISGVQPREDAPAIHDHALAVGFRLAKRIGRFFGRLRDADEQSLLPQFLLFDLFGQRVVGVASS